MSAMYYKIEPQFAPTVTYGYRTASAEEVDDIVSRMTRPTCNSRFDITEPQPPVLYQKAAKNRPVSACVRWTNSPSLSLNLLMRRNDKDIDRITRRMRKQTTCSIMKHADRNYDRNYDPYQIGTGCFNGSMIPLVAVTGEKAAGFLRPTTSSSAKSAENFVHNRQRRARSAPPLRPGQSSTVTPLESASATQVRHLEHVTAGTHASAQTPCRREWTTQADHTMLQSEDLPLISGLERSRNVGEIVDRLHRHPARWRRPICTDIFIPQ